MEASVINENLLALSNLKQNIESKKAKLAVIGLGYVGLPVACMFSDAGFDVLGVEIIQERVNKINQGISPIEGKEPGLAELLAKVVNNNKLKATTQYDALTTRDVILIDVETPVDENNIPRYEALRSALNSLAPHLKQHALVIVESTIAPGTMREVVQPILEEKSGKRVNIDFFLGNCPERVMPGKLLSNLCSLSRVVGGNTPQTAETMISLYQHIVQADLDPTDCVTAEIVKTAENAYRDVQIAFANELALICQALDSDVWRVRELVNKSPGRNVHLPGAGVGGHCIPKDPWLLAYGVKDKHVPLHLIPAARHINDHMPIEVAKLLKHALATCKKNLQGSRILVLGYAYLENSDDDRNSPTKTLVDYLQKENAEVIVHDPFISQYKGHVIHLAENAHAVVLMVAHSEYLTIDLERLRTALRLPIFIDGRGVFAHHPLDEEEWIYRCLGKGNNE